MVVEFFMSMNKRVSTRDHILLLLKTNGQMSTKQLQQKLGLSKMAVHRQMINLERDGFVQYILGRHQLGRPMHYYSLTQVGQKQFPSDDGKLAVELLIHFMIDEGEERLKAYFTRQQARFIDKNITNMQGKELPKRIAELARIQENNGFMAEWEQQDKEIYIIKQHNCPYLQIANRFDILCETELNGYRALLKADVERTECVARGSGHCIYVVRPAQELTE
ncbi:winged helix-turn-helix transcriptional regulator [Brevibacillus sp. M2.1A]|uniref:helix-turn-helix transcriptional regulator n=1 Tax=Brevibacillus sp. M2.1A TaxID=2738980 RepID=UPI001E2CCEFE|nr:winged helix-turn-helix transcriptional regulator [Brevibacillus sp. M2.1A]MCC8438528.1 winged helix-turn-helix transcriptional regulator [Brevibacillus sp. M2.1A]